MLGTDDETGGTTVDGVDLACCGTDFDAPVSAELEEVKDFVKAEKASAACLPNNPPGEGRLIGLFCGLVEGLPVGFANGSTLC